MVGLFTFFTIGTAVLVDLWNILDYKKGLSMVRHKLWIAFIDSSGYDVAFRNKFGATFSRELWGLSSSLSSCTCHSSGFTSKSLNIRALAIAL
jgi:hypothetical protein